MIGLLRLLCALLLAFGAAAGWQLAEITRHAERISPAIFAGWMLWALLLLATLLATVAPKAVWLRIVAVLQQSLRRLRARREPLAHEPALVLLVATGIVLLLLLARFYVTQTDALGNDQEAFLRDAKHVATAGGPARLIQQLFAGQFREANRHPLYIGLLSVRPTFAAGKILSALFGVLTFVLVAGVAWRRFGSAVALFASGLLATNYAFCYFATRVTCESVLVFCTALGWAALVERSGENAHRWNNRQLARGVIAGAALGLAWLAKGTGLLLLMGALLWSVLLVARNWQQRRNLSRDEPWYRPALLPVVLLAAWIVVASPLLTRNMRLYDQPLYNVNSYYMFTDQFILEEQLDPEKSVAEYAKEYLRTHSLGQLVGREVKGLIWEAFILLRSLGPVPLDTSRMFFGMALLVLALLGMAAERRADALLVLIWLAASLVLFAWYVPIAAGERFILPLVPPLLVYAASGLWRIAQALSPASWQRVMIAATIVWCGVWLVSSLLVADLNLPAG